MNYNLSKKVAAILNIAGLKSWLIKAYAKEHISIGLTSISKVYLEYVNTELENKSTGTESDSQSSTSTNQSDFFNRLFKVYNKKNDPILPVSHEVEGNLRVSQLKTEIEAYSIFIRDPPL